MNNINNNSYGKNLYDKLLIKQNIDTKDIETQLISSSSIGKKYNEELIKLDQTQNEMVDSFLNRMQQDNEKAELIVLKMATGKNITKEELEFISKKYPEMKKVAEQVQKESNDLKILLKKCNTSQERQQLISLTLNKIKVMLKKGTISDFEAKIKTLALEEVTDFSRKIYVNDKKAEVISIKIFKGEKLTTDEKNFISEKYPKLKQTSEMLNQEIKFLKVELSQFNGEDRQNIILKVIKNIDKIIKNNESSSSEVHISKEAQKEVVKLSKHIEKELINVDKISVKIIKGEVLNTKEERFINENYPYIKKIAKELAKEYVTIKEELKDCKTQEQKQQVIYSKIENKEEFIKDSTILNIYEKLKMIALDDINIDYKTKRNENEIKYNLNPFIFFNSKLLSQKNAGAIIVITLICTIYILGKILA